MQHWTVSEPGTQKGTFFSGISGIIKKNNLAGLTMIKKKKQQKQNPKPKPTLNKQAS